MSVPRWWHCQSCRQPLDIVGAEDFIEKSPFNDPEALRSNGYGSAPGSAALAASRSMDSSFVVLPKQPLLLHQPQRPPFPPSAFPGRPSHPSAAPRLHAASPGATCPPNQRAGGGGAQPAGPGLPGVSGLGFEAPGGRGGMEESFVVLPNAAASMYMHEGGGEAASQGSPTSPRAGKLDTRMMGLSRVFDLAAQQTLVDQPVCCECSRTLMDELAADVHEVEEDIEAYKACLKRFEEEAPAGQEALQEEEFEREMEEAEAEERQLLAELGRIEGQRAAVRAEREEVEKKAAQAELLEQRYWHEWNAFHLQQRAYQEERDAVETRIVVASAQLEHLKRCNVLNDAFHIWHEGDFGTINGFRLGRLPNIAVEWDEINAAWGQACLLLLTMAQECRLTFSYQILPMGSYPRIKDGKNTYDLYGPVNLFFSTRYDRAMVLFLACLKEFAEFAYAKDGAAGVPSDRRFQLPYKIEGDKVHGLTVKQCFNREALWTRALFHTLSDLKWALGWLINNIGSASTASSKHAAA
eukprot:TRINITY_DN1362_c0_g1_i1.p1 TRINITY_DN1362_c0_g1~~TRINITY_DN1362_c0_g1_i1.p1  ORF type:complete len:524 (+),score=127.37 TRINITY_DN1362_c0_g1_i1:178-1749(+)